MKLETILYLIEENTTVKVIDYFDGSLLSEYDGKNSIDEELNDCDVACISAQTDGKPYIEIIVITD